jgi:dephospho-CoA kinase
MKLIGLTGNMGTGKTLVSKVFSILGVPVYSADLSAREIMNRPETINHISLTFGKNVVGTDGKIDRKLLASIVFDNASQLHLLNQIIHPRVEADFRKWCTMQKNAPYIIHEAAILFESGFDKMMDANILVTAPIEMCIARVMHRDKISEEDVKARLSKQWEQETKAGLADFIIHNNETEMVIPQVLKIHNLILAPDNKG